MRGHEDLVPILDREGGPPRRLTVSDGVDPSHVHVDGPVEQPETPDQQVVVSGCDETKHSYIQVDAATDHLSGLSQEGRLGWTSGGGRAAGRASAACPSRRTSAGSEGDAMSRHDPAAARSAVVAQGAVRAGVPAQPSRGGRARGVPGGPLLLAARSRAPAGGGCGQGRVGPGDEVDRSAPGAGRQSRLPSAGPRPGRPLSPARSANSARGSERSGLCAPERAQALAPAARDGAARAAGSGVLGPVVRRLARAPTGSRGAGGRGATKLAPHDRLASSSAHRSR